MERWKDGEIVGWVWCKRSVMELTELWKLFHPLSDLVPLFLSSHRYESLPILFPTKCSVCGFFFSFLSCKHLTRAGAIWVHDFHTLSPCNSATNYCMLFWPCLGWGYNVHWNNNYLCSWPFLHNIGSCWLNMWWIWYTKLETLQEFQSRHLIGWVLFLGDVCDTFCLMVHLETNMPWRQTPLWKKQAVVVYNSDNEHLSESTKRWICKSMWCI